MKLVARDTWHKLLHRIGWWHAELVGIQHQAGCEWENGTAPIGRLFPHCCKWSGIIACIDCGLTREVK